MSWITSTSHARDGGLYFKVLQPAPELRGWVRYYWVLKDDARAPQVDEYLAPDGFEEIIFSYAGGFKRAEVFGSDSRQDVVERSYVVGCKPYGVTCSRTGRLAMIGVKLWPQVLHAFLRTPLHDLSGRPLSLSNVNSPALNELESQLFDAASERQIKDILDRSLLSATPSHFNGLLSFSMQQLFESRGTVTVDELVNRCGVHYRTLEKAFRQAVGVAPKTVAKVLRFKHTFEALSAGANARGFSTTECGYYDQSHFCREFKAFTGQTPTRFFRERLSIDVAKFCLALDSQRLDHSGSAAEFAL